MGEWSCGMRSRYLELITRVAEWCQASFEARVWLWALMMELRRRGRCRCRGIGMDLFLLAEYWMRDLEDLRAGDNFN